MKKRCYGCMEMKYSSPICEHCGFDEGQENASHQLPLGTVLRGQYLTGKVLGQGGFGITYLGWDLTLDMPVAVKEFFPRGSVGRDSTQSVEVFSYNREQDPAFEANKKRFLREAQTLAKLENIPQVVRIRSFFEENNTAYIVMEYIRGQNLKDYMVSRGGTIPAEALFPLLKPTLEALMKVHETGLVHRDISPDNIMLLPDGSTKLLDFGAVRYVEHAGVEKALTHSTQAILKHGFAPIEQYQSKGSLGPWTDVYALCGTIYYCLTGRVPPEAGERIIEGEPLSWETIPGLTKKQLEALEQGTAVLPKNRLPSVKALYDKLYDRTEEMERLRRLQQEELARLERERLERQRLERERLEKERLERERLEKERLEQERLERQRLKREQLEKEKQERQRQKQEKREKEEQKRKLRRQTRDEQEKAARERREQERLQKSLYTAEIIRNENFTSTKEDGTVVLTGIESIPKPKKKKKWWIPAVAALLTLVVGAGVLMGGEEGHLSAETQPGGSVMEYPTVPAQTEETGFVIKKYGSALEGKGENLHIQVENGDTYTVTLSGLEIRESYIQNMATSERNHTEYSWSVRMYDNPDREHGYEITSRCWATSPGQERTLTFRNMPTVLMEERETDRWYDVCDARSSNTEDSVTWTFKMPEGSDFSFEQVKLLDVIIRDVTNEAQPVQEYTVEVKGVDVVTEQTASARRTGDTIRIDGGNLSVEAVDSKQFAVTLSGLDIQESYLTNLDTSKKNNTDYYWEIGMYLDRGEETGYKVTTSAFADKPGKKNKIILADMVPALREVTGKHQARELDSDVAMTYTDSSITWTFTLPEGHTLLASDIKLLSVYVYDITKGDSNADRYYVSVEGVEEYPEASAVFEESDGVMTISTENAQVRTADGKNFTVTLSGLDIQSRYVKNLPDSWTSLVEYSWGIRLYTDRKKESGYEIETRTICDNPGEKQNISIDQMGSVLMEKNLPNSWRSVCDAAMTHTDSSITWTFTIPEDCSLRLDQVELLEIGVTNRADAAQNRSPEIYAVEDPGKTVQIRKSGNMLEATAKNLYIQVKNQKEYTVTLSGLNLRGSYTKNLPDSTKGESEYRWHVDLYTGDDDSLAYGIWTTCNAEEPGNQKNVTIDSDGMWHAVMRKEKNSSTWNGIEYISMTHTQNSITWKFTMPDSEDFRFEDVTRIEVGITDRGNPEQPNQNYTYPVKEEPPIPLEQYAELKKTGNQMEAKWENLHIRVKNGREYTATVTGLNIRDSYQVNLPDTQRGYGEYVWSLRLGDYWADTGVWAIGSGGTKTITMAQMQNNLLKNQGLGQSMLDVGELKMTHTKDSITWTFTLPEDPAFRFEELDCVNLMITDVSGEDPAAGYYTYYLSNSGSPKSGKDAVTELSFENVKIQVENERDYTVTLSGLDIRESYTTNLKSSSENTAEYCWDVRMYTKEDKTAGYSIGTFSWAFEPGKNEEKTIDKMPSTLYVLTGNQFQYVPTSNLRMTHTETSITWTFKLPEDVDFRLEDVKLVDFSTTDVANSENNSYKSYPVTKD